MQHFYVIECYYRFLGFSFYPHRITVRENFTDAYALMIDIGNCYCSFGYQRDVLYEEFNGKLPAVNATVVHNYTKFLCITEQIKLSTL